MIQYIDAHCHILSGAQMRDAAARGVGRFIVNATQPTDWNAVIKMAQKENIFGAIGVHPWFVADLPDGWDVQMIGLLTENPNFMVGEIGLDKNRSDMERQIAVFTRQLQIAHDFGRIAHIHCVGAWGKMMDVLHGANLPPAMVFHCFSGSAEIMCELSKINGYFSFGADIVNGKHRNMRDAVANAPENRILVESDAPDCAMPDTIPGTVAEIAQIRGVPAENMARIIYDNTMGMLNEQSV